MSEQQPFEQANSRVNAEATAGSEDSSSNGSCERDSEEVFDKLYAEFQKNEKAKYQSFPPFQPVIYDANNPPRKFRRMIALGHEYDLRERLRATTSLTDKQVDLYARTASYLPGLKYQPLNCPVTYSWSPSTISLSNSDTSGSPKYLFKDLPLELPKRKSKSTTTGYCDANNCATSSSFLKLANSSGIYEETTEKTTADVDQSSLQNLSDQSDYRSENEWLKLPPSPTSSLLTPKRLTIEDDLTRNKCYAWLLEDDRNNSTNSFS
ncbi:uncharacterized protein LOC131666363 isoform X2 [Phymastichus coffea]|uniref:uncharacterized protein LOC131666363 isoform X2 n=1 Tax=Phymastichus coffea TaxID=108790 RepID=UPI00273C2AF9|nr:uncharacterized protein LOC131666363 isoform X2 [Phymastichus coffea]